MQLISLPARGAIGGFFAGLVGAFISDLMGLSDGGTPYLWIPLTAMAGGYIGGLIRQRRMNES